MLKNHRTFFAILLVFYAGLGLLTAITLKPIVKDTRAYRDFNPVWDSVFSILPIGLLEQSKPAQSKPAVDSMKEPVAAPVAETQPAPAEIVSAEPTEPAPVADEPAPAATERKYYSFVTSNVEQILYVRTQPGLDKKSIARLKPGTKGYVLQEGPNWCYIIAGDIIGFSSTEYLKLTEVPKEQFPQDYLNIVSPFPLDVPNR